MQVYEQKTSELKAKQPPQKNPQKTPAETKTEENVNILYNWMTEVCTKTRKVYEIQVTVHSFFSPLFSLIPFMKIDWFLVFFLYKTENSSKAKSSL